MINLLKYAKELTDKQRRLANILAPLGTTAALGAGTYAWLRHPSYSSNPILRQIQQMSKGEVKALVENKPKGLLRQKLRELVRGPEITKEELKAAPFQKAVWTAKAESIPGIFDPGFGPVVGKHRAENKKFVNEMLDKLREARFVNRFAPEALPKTLNVKDIANKYKIDIKNPKRYPQNLQRLQDALKQEIGDRYILKYRKDPLGIGGSEGFFPTEKTDLANEYKLWQILKPKFQKALRTGDAFDVVSAFRQQPGYVGKAIDELLNDNLLVQERLRIRPYPEKITQRLEARGLSAVPEYRVHVIGGEAHPLLTVPRTLSRTGFTPVQTVKDLIEAQKARNWVQKEVLNKFPEQFKGVSYAMDVVPIEGQPGKFKLLELNTGQESGFFDPDLATPIPRHLLHRVVTGRHTQGAAGLLGAGTGLLGGGASGLLTHKLTEKD